MTNKTRGFTLIELLVVISIIGILASLALASYSGAQKQARDTERRSDINQYRNGLESYASVNNGLYPSGTLNPTSFCGETGVLDEFLSVCPDDPLSASEVYYSYSSDGSKYILFTDLETAGYWYVCSTGKNGLIADPPTLASECP